MLILERDALTATAESERLQVAGGGAHLPIGDLDLRRAVAGLCGTASGLSSLRQCGESKIRSNATQAEPQCQFRGKQKARTMRALSNSAAASTPSRRLPVNLGAIQVWYKVETNCCGVGNQVWKSWEVQFLELLARESHTVPPSQRLSSGAPQDSELRARSFRAIWIAAVLAATGMERHGTKTIRSSCCQEFILRTPRVLFRDRTLPFERANWKR